MKSKTSFFNKTVFEKNIKLFWPLWALYMIILLLMGPLSMWSRYRTAENYYGKDWHLHMSGFLSPAIAMRPTVIIIFIMAVCTGMALFNYLYSQKACNMIHAMPVTRTQLYFTNVITGLVIMWFPQIVRFVISLMICISNGMTDIKPLGIWLLSSMAISFLAYGIVCFSVMLTGQLLALPIMYIVINFLYVIIVGAFSVVTSYISYGVDAIEMFLGIRMWEFSPFMCVLKNVYFSGTMKETKNDYYCTGYDFYGTKLIIMYVAVAVILYAAALFLYKKRKLESAGNFISVDVLKPIIKWGGGCIIGYLLAAFISELLHTVKVNINFFGYVLLSLFIGIIVFLLVQMLILKSFKVIKRKVIKEIGCFTVFMVVLFGGLYLNAVRLTNIIPDEKDVDRVYVCADYKIKLTGDDIKKAIETQKALIAQKDKYFKHRDDNMDDITISYRLKNGETISRNYSLPSEHVKIEDICKNIIEEEKEPENLLKYIFSFNPDEGKVLSGTAEEYDEDYDPTYDIQFGPKAAQAIYEALKKDAQEGNVQKYIISYLYGDPAKQRYNYTISLDLLVPAGTEMNDGYAFYEDRFPWPVNKIISGMSGGYMLMDDSYSYSSYQTSVGFSFGPECTNIVQALIDNKIIDSEDELKIMEN